jgi:RNA polymerase sigma-70 factor (ECF subfamily)
MNSVSAGDGASIRAGGDLPRSRAAVDPTSRPAGARVAELLPRHLPVLRAYVRRRAGALLRRRESGSDLVQSACRELLTRSADFEGDETAFRRWLFRTAERKLVDRARHWRAERRDPAREAGVATELQAGPASGCTRTPSREAELAEDVLRLERALARLSPDHRDVVRLARLEGLPHREVGHRMGRSEGAVRALLFRALAEVALEMGERDPGRAPSGS